MTTSVESITVVRSGIVELKFRKQPADPYNESDDVRGWHRTTLVPGEDIDAALVNLNASLASIGVLPVDDGSCTRIKTQCAAAWTEEVVAAFKAQSQ